MAKPPAPPKAPSRAKAPAAPKAPQGPKVGKTQGPPPVALHQVTIHRIGVPLPKLPTPQSVGPIPRQVGPKTHVVHHPRSGRVRTVHEIGPNAHLVITHPRGGPGASSKAVGATKRKAVSGPTNTSLRNSGNPNAFKFGGGRGPTDGGELV